MFINRLTDIEIVSSQGIDSLACMLKWIDGGAAGWMGIHGRLGIMGIAGNNKPIFSTGIPVASLFKPREVACVDSNNT